MDRAAHDHILVGLASAKPSEPSRFAGASLIAAVLITAVIFGGGGVRYGLANLVVQLIALAVLALFRDEAIAFFRKAPITLRVGIGLTILIPALQLAPLPANIWTALPGRELVREAFELAGHSGWAPFSVDPVRTMVALSALTVPLAILAVGWTLPIQRLIQLGWLIAILGLATLLLGVPQVLSAGSSGLIYELPGSTGALYGSFANRNSTGLFLVSALTLAALLPAPLAHRSFPLVRVLLCALLVVAIILTRSRTALILSAIPLVLAAVRAIAWSRRNRDHRGSLARLKPAHIIAALGLAIGAIVVTVIVAPGQVGTTLERFEARDDARRYIWEDAAYSTSRYWPAGAGMGTFDEVFQVDESLENATQRRAGRAHNDYIEVAIEAGLAGVLLIAFWIGFAAWLAWRARRSGLQWIAWSGGAILLSVALQSITDYPLRNLGMLATASFALLLLARASTSQTDAQE